MGKTLAAPVPEDELTSIIRTVAGRHMEQAIPGMCNMIIGGVLARQVRETGGRVVEQLLEPLANQILTDEMVSRVSFEMRRFLSEDERMAGINDMVDEDIDVYLTDMIPEIVPEIARAVVIEELDRRGLNGPQGGYNATFNQSGNNATGVSGNNGTFNLSNGGGNPNATFNQSNGGNPNATFNQSGNGGNNGTFNQCNASMCLIFARQSRELKIG